VAEANVNSKPRSFEHRGDGDEFPGYLFDVCAPAGVGGPSISGALIIHQLPDPIANAGSDRTPRS
jgi:hypothetical protein